MCWIQDHPVVMTKFIEGAREIEMDAVAKNGKVCVVGLHVTGNLELYGSLSGFRPVEGHISYNGPYGDAPIEKGTLFRLEIYKRVGISRVEV